VAEKLAANLKTKFPGLQVAGAYSPPFRSIENLAEDDLILKNIEDAETDILWVGLGGPKQEFWMVQHCSRISVPIMLGVGAAVDFHSGTKAWAPRPIRVLGLEWIFRMLSGGPRTFVRNISACTRVAIHLARKRISH
jgi:N-acetylglucosaminyldiphosphoundecaprenol N-acetyl-beta-D-mannosaminyltransferase